MQIQPRIQTLSRIASPKRAGFPVLVSCNTQANPAGSRRPLWVRNRSIAS